MNAIDKIHQFNRFGSRLGLERMTVLLDKLGNPHEDLDVIHVAGTNGKGSVCKYLEEGLSACGYKIGLYTSPFIERFNERIRLGGQDISDEDLQSFTDRVLKASDEMVAEGLDSPTEFEVVTAIAFLYFKEKGADILNNIKRISDEWNEILYEEMSEEEIACMKKLTNKMVENIASHMD